MGVDRNSLAEFIKRNSHQGNAKQIIKIWFRLGLKLALISLVTLLMANIAPFLAGHTFDRVLVLVAINVCVLPLGISMWRLSISTVQKLIMKPPAPQVKHSKWSAITAAMVPVSGVFGMYIGRIFLNDLTQNSALLLALFLAAILYSITTFGTCKMFYMVYLIWRYNKT